MDKRLFGTLADGTEVFLYTLQNANGMKVGVTDFGGTWVNTILKDKNGIERDVVLGYDSPQGYIENTCYFGAVIGRNGNRIGKAKFEINGRTYQLEVNDNENNLHSGLSPYSVRKWDVVKAEGSSITFGLNSPDGDQGFPGNFHVEVTYTLTDDNEVVLHYEGTSDADTVANMTNHSYFNLGGHDSGAVLEQTLMIPTEYYTPVVDSQAIPTGEVASVKGTPMDFTEAKKIGRDIEEDFEQLKFGGGFDHNYALSNAAGTMKKMAEAYCEATGIRMEAFTDCAGVHFYAGNMIAEHTGKGGVIYGKRHGFCLESQYYPNAVNQENFASPLLKAGEKYDTVTSYKFTVE